MADAVRISLLPPGGTVLDDDLFVIARLGENFKLSGTNLRNYLATDLTAIQTQVNTLELDRLKLDGSNGPMTGMLSMGSNKIIDLGNPVNATDAVNKNYIDTNFLMRIL
jgi:hypothetical protein